MENTKEKVELSQEQIESYIKQMNDTIDNTPFAYLLGRELCGVLFYLLVGSVRSKVFRTLLTKAIQYCDEASPDGAFPEYLSHCLKERTCDIFSSVELDNYFHARVSQDTKLENVED